MAIIPPANALNAKSFITYRRLWLDTFLNEFKTEISGNVLDIGGKRGKKRGAFDPTEIQTKNWWYVNLDMSTNPNVYSDASLLPFSDECVDITICTEVLEHLKYPLECVTCIHRVLKGSGKAFFSVPFLYPVHADPYDFQRYTADGLQHLLSCFSSVSIYPMGGFLGTLGMFIEIGLHGVTGMHINQKITRRGLTWLARNLYKADLRNIDRQPAQWSKFTTGYFIKAIK